MERSAHDALTPDALAALEARRIFAPRSFLKGAGALIVSFSVWAGWPLSMRSAG